jgi:TolB-like protein
VYRVVLEPGLPALIERLRHLFSARWFRLAGATVLGVLVAELLGLFPRSPLPRPQPPKKPFAVVVRPFTILKADPAHAWMPSAMRSYFSSYLSRVPNLKVYSEEHFDFVVQSSSLSLQDVAKQLGITKMIAGSFLVLGNGLRLEVHLEDVEGMSREPSDEVKGEEEEFFNLLQQLAGKTTDRLKITVPTEKPGETPPSSAGSLDNLKLMLEGEGETSVEIPAKETPRLQNSPRKGERHSGVPMWQAWPAARAAWADEAPPSGTTSEEEVRQVLEQYRRAYEQKDLVMLEKLYTNFTPAQREANEKYFQNAQNLRVTLRDVDIALRENEAAVSYSREDEFIDAKTGQNVKLPLRFTKIFIRTDSGWKMVVGKK